VKSNPPEHFLCRADVMGRFVDVLEERHGGAEGWARAHDLGDETFASLRETLLQ
jgi:hypothetical protein